MIPILRQFWYKGDKRSASQRFYERNGFTHNLPIFLCKGCFGATGLEESLTMGSYLPRNCMICGEIVPKGEDYNWIWSDNLQQFSIRRLFHKHKWEAYGCKEPNSNNHYIGKVCKKCERERIIDSIVPIKDYSGEKVWV